MNDRFNGVFLLAGATLVALLTVMVVSLLGCNAPEPVADVSGDPPAAEDAPAAQEPAEAAPWYERFDLTTEQDRMDARAMGHTNVLLDVHADEITDEVSVMAVIDCEGRSSIPVCAMALRCRNGTDPYLLFSLGDHFVSTRNFVENRVPGMLRLDSRHPDEVVLSVLDARMIWAGQDQLGRTFEALPDAERLVLRLHDGPSTPTYTFDVSTLRHFLPLIPCFE